MAKAYRGVCPLCKREDVLLTSKNGECHRCYKRTSMGQDPLADKRDMPKAPVKAPVKAAKVKAAKVKAAKVKAAKVKAAKVKAAEPVAVVKPALLPAEVRESDEAAFLRSVFVAKLEAWLEDMNGATSVKSRARMFLSMADVIESLVY